MGILVGSLYNKVTPISKSVSKETTHKSECMQELLSRSDLFLFWSSAVMYRGAKLYKTGAAVFYH